MKADFEKGTKVCSKCKMELPIEMFNKNKSKPDGLDEQCKECRVEYNNKTRNTFSGTKRNCRGKSHIIKRDYELTEEQLQKRELQRKGHNTRNKKESVYGLLVWYDGQLKNLDKREYKKIMDREYFRQRNCAIRGYIGITEPSEHFLFDFDLEQMLKDNVYLGGKNKLYITKWWDGEIRHWTVNDGIWKK